MQQQQQQQQPGAGDADRCGLRQNIAANRPTTARRARQQRRLAPACIVRRALMMKHQCGDGGVSFHSLLSAAAAAAAALMRQPDARTHAHINQCELRTGTSIVACTPAASARLVTNHVAVFIDLPTSGDAR